MSAQFVSTVKDIEFFRVIIVLILCDILFGVKHCAAEDRLVFAVPWSRISRKAFAFSLGIPQAALDCGHAVGSISSYVKEIIITFVTLCHAAYQTGTAMPALFFDYHCGQHIGIDLAGLTGFIYRIHIFLRIQK